MEDQFLKNRLSVMRGWSLLLGFLLLDLLFIGLVSLDYYVFQVFVITYHMDWNLFRGMWIYTIYGLTASIPIVLLLANLLAVKKRFLTAWNQIAPADKRKFPEAFRNWNKSSNVRIGDKDFQSRNKGSYLRIGDTIFYYKYLIFPVIFNIKDVIWAYGTRTPLEMPIVSQKEINISIYMNELYGVTMVTKSGRKHHVSVSHFAELEKLFSYDVILGYGRTQKQEAKEKLKIAREWDERAQKEWKDRTVFRAKLVGFIAVVIMLIVGIFYFKILKIGGIGEWV